MQLAAATFDLCRWLLLWEAATRTYVRMYRVYSSVDDMSWTVQAGRQTDMIMDTMAKHEHYHLRAVCALSPSLFVYLPPSQPMCCTAAAVAVLIIQSAAAFFSTPPHPPPLPAVLPAHITYTQRFDITYTQQGKLKT